MREKTVRRRIFMSNTLMVLVTLGIFFVINALMIWFYSETVEQQVKSALGARISGDELKAIVEEYTIHKNTFLLLFLADGLICIVVLVLVSRLFTGNLVKHIMIPIQALTEGAKRIQDNDLTQNVVYEGEVEFETVCQNFNAMRQSILSEQQKNQKYEKARTDMIAGISHDLRTPLTAIRGTIKALLDRVVMDAKQQEKFLETAYRRAGDMNILLDQLFYLSKLETGNMPMQMQKIGIADFIRNYVKSKWELFEQEEVLFSCETGQTDGKVTVDPEQLLRVLDNLLENSLKYAQTSPLRIRLSLEETKDAFIIRFSDNGIGVAKEQIPFLFDEFYRGDESRNQKEGNGLGLYIVKCLIEAMDGKVWAENENGFIVCIMLKKKEEKQSFVDREEK